MKLLVGLGNPGKKYEQTRHNVGFIILDHIALEQGVAWEQQKKANALIAKHGQTILAKPQTFMNNSGSSVQKLAAFYGVSLADLVVVHDDVDLEFGKTKFALGMGSAGHHGIEDIIEKLGSKEFWRLRVGVGRPSGEGAGKFEVEDYVLGNFTAEELEVVVQCKSQLLF